VGRHGGTGNWLLIEAWKPAIYDVGLVLLVVYVALHDHDHESLVTIMQTPCISNFLPLIIIIIVTGSESHTWCASRADVVRLHMP